MKISFKINGEYKEMDVQDDLRLIDLIRDKLHLTGTKEGCGEGECGACTVILNGKNVPSCLILAAEVDGKEIITIEGLNKSDKLHPIAESFIEKGAVQCGFCTPGMILSSKVLLDNNLSPTRQEIKKALEGNLCRCTGYSKIIDAVEDAAEKLKKVKVVI